ncbi:L-amino acid N-acyltransferase YncA [Amycolatopsis arida]|uniref:L-amino acid N-acyltransferase YncA n=1 Tax=Amycolatopsis arida TaxID=587909 RepID=A0A1I5VEU0_9PSEU|nr:GNAT family N-acetyltransferase [Amycolatopsis arida]TDX91256.1 L-amino acid N-acyltransferase YncA [Amycolatopsis arida]SFQ05993.1 L-amino acid N-acyltransferase YncA [Amycolatopsis arida]
MSTAEVRPATPADAPEIARIQRMTWRTAYAELVGDRALAELDAPGTERRWAAAIEHPGTAVYVAVEGVSTVGFCVAGPAPEEEVAGADGALPADAARVGLVATMLVEPRWGRRGHGGRLLATAAAGLRAAGAERGITWAAQSDSATLAFFRRAGWHPDGTVRTLDTGEKTLREIRLTGTLDLRLATP